MERWARTTATRHVNDSRPLQTVAAQNGRTSFLSCAPIRQDRAKTSSTYTRKLPYDGLCPNFNATVRLYHFPERFPAVSGPASHCKNDSPLVRRLSGRLDRLRPFLPIAAPARIPLLSLDYPLFASQGADAPAHRTAGRQPADAAGDPQCVVEAVGRRRSYAAYSRPAWRDDRAALLSAFDNRAADSGMVRARTS